jgi:hypothetical protein
MIDADRELRDWLEASILVLSLYLPETRPKPG